MFNIYYKDLLGKQYITHSNYCPFLLSSHVNRHHMLNRGVVFLERQRNYKKAMK